MDADRRRILEWLEANAPALVPVYDGAVRMILEPEFPGRVHFIAHAMREIMNRLPDAFTDDDHTGRVEYPELVGDIAACWKEGELPTDQCREAVETLLRQHKVPPTKNRERAEQLFKATISEVPSDYTKLAALWMETRQGGEKRAHISNHKKPTSEGSLPERFNDLETLLKTLSTRSYEDMDRIDEILDITHS